jgi:sulfatase maturation enzyme AslB (radical SAM superfamily)
VPESLYQDIGSNPTTWAAITAGIADSCRTHDSVSITLLGGESLIQPGAVKLIDWLIDQQLPVSLNITTNLTNLNTQLVKRLQYFNQVSIFASIDSVGNNYEYVRWPAKFDTIAGNLKRISQLNNTSLTIQPVWSLNNIFYIVDFLDWWHQWFDENYKVPIRNVVMHRPHYMTIQNLPIRYRPQLITVLGTALDHPIFKGALQESLYHYVSGIKTFLESGQVVHDQFDLFLYETARQDRATNSDFKIGNSRLYSILTESDRQLYQQHPRLDLLPSSQQIVYTQHSPL